MGLIHDIPTCAELLSRIEKEAEETIEKHYGIIALTAKL